METKYLLKLIERYLFLKMKFVQQNLNHALKIYENNLRVIIYDKRSIGSIK